MHCTKCGAVLAPGAKFCTTCGAAVETYAPAEAYAPAETYAPAEAYAPQYAPVEYAPEYAPVEAPMAAPEAENKEGFKIDVSAVKDRLVETLKPITDKVKPILAKKAVRFGIIGGFALLIVLGIVLGLLGNSGGFVTMKQTTKLEQVEGELKIIVNGKLIKDTIELGYQRDRDGEIIENDGKKEYRDWSTARSLDGKVTVVWVYGEVYESEDSWYSTTTGDLYVIKGKKLHMIAEDVYDYDISVSGKGISYMTKNERDEDDKFTTYTLKLYNVGNKKTTTISDEVASSSVAIAPDGKSVAYFEGDEGEEEYEIEYTLMYSNGKKTEKITSNEVNLIGMSNNGKHIYAIRSNESEEDLEYTLYSYNTKGEGNKLGKIDSEYSYDVSFNKDHTQVMFINEGKTYISTKGKEAVKAYSGELSLITPANAGYSYRTNPVSNLYNHAYVAKDDEGNRSVMLIKKNSEKNAKLASKASNVQIDQSGEYLYYLYDGEDARVTKISYGEKATEKFTVLAEDVDGFMATPNGKYIYFLSDDTLYSTNGKKGGKKTIVCSEDVDDAVITTKGALYYIMDGDLYVTTNGKKGKKVLSDVENVSSTASGQVYAETADALYVSTGSKKLKKLMDLG